MKIRCDVCEKAEASVYCWADEAALCNSCDHHVHHANKLSVKHNRFSLIFPSIKDYPLCDICQERRAFLFCQEDRAILCKECDAPIHTANEHTEKHNRFLLTGVKLSSICSLYPNFSSFNDSAAAIDAKRLKSVSNEMNRGSSIGIGKEEIMNSANYVVEDCQIDESGTFSESNASELLMESFPVWCVDEFLDPSMISNGFCMMYSTPAL